MPEQIPNEGKFSIKTKTNDEIYLEEILGDSGATLNVITEDKCKELIDKSNNIIKISQGKKFLVENGGEEDVLFDGRFITLSINKPTTDTYIEFKFYISPTDISYPMIMGTKYLKQLGYQLVLLDDENNCYVH